MSKKNKNNNKNDFSYEIEPHKLTEINYDKYFIVNSKKVVFSFSDNYLEKEDEIKEYKGKDFRNLIGKMKEISKYSLFELKNRSNLIKKIELRNSKDNEYKKIFGKHGFKQFEDDFYEIIGADTCRLFGYFIGNIFNIVLFKHRHLEIKKK